MENNEFKFDRMPEAYPAGGYKCMLSEEALKRQSGAIWDMIKQVFGASISGFIGGGDKDLIGISLPVRIFEPRSYLERITDSWCYATELLYKAALEKDPVERLKLIICFAIGGLHNTCRQKKPFNPILGETYEASYEDGAQIFCEQVSHHPPVTAWQVFGPGNSYKFYGYGEWVASFSVNAVSGQQKGRHVIEFQDGSKIVYNLPQVVLQGVLWGERVMNYEGTINFIDEKNGIGAVIYIPPPQDPISWAAWWGGATKLPTDYLGGQVYKLKGNPHTKGDTISNLVGSWLGRIEFDGKIYWSIKANLKKNIPIAAKKSSSIRCQIP